MSERLQPPMPPTPSSIEQQNMQFGAERQPLTVMNTELGGGRRGGDMAIPLGNEPLESSQDGFMIDNSPAELLAIVYPGGEEDSINTIGIAKTNLLTKDGVSSEVMLVNLVGNLETGYKVEEAGEKKNPRALKLQEGVTTELGRGSGTTGDFIIRKDPRMSANHLSIRLENGQVSLLDTKSLNGTEVKSMGTPDKFTEDDLQSDMNKLREEKGLNPKKVGEIGSGALGASGVDIAQMVADLPPIPNLIDSVPGSGQAAPERLSPAELQRREISTLEQELAELSEQYQAISSGMSTEQSNALWRLASAQVRKEHAERFKRFAEAAAEKREIFEAGQQVNRQPEAVRSQAPEFNRVFRLINNKNARLWSLQNPGAKQDENPYL